MEDITLYEAMDAIDELVNEAYEDAYYENKFTDAVKKGGSKFADGAKRGASAYKKGLTFGRFRDGSTKGEKIKGLGKDSLSYLAPAALVAGGVGGGYALHKRNKKNREMIAALEDPKFRKQHPELVDKYRKALVKQGIIEESAADEFEDLVEKVYDAYIEGVIDDDEFDTYMDYLDLDNYDY